MKEATDLEIAIFYEYHIRNPCGFEHNGVIVNVRPVYLREARNILEKHKFKNPYAREILEEAVKEYS